MARPKLPSSARNTQPAGHRTVPAAPSSSTASSAIQIVFRTMRWVTNARLITTGQVDRTNGSVRQIVRSSPRLASLLHAFRALASGGRDEEREIFLAVVVGDLVARLYRLDRPQDHLAPDQVGFGIRTAGMVGVAHDVAAARAVDAPATIDLEYVAGTAPLPPF